MRYRLRTLMVLLAALPPAIWGTYFLYSQPMPTEPILSPSEFETVVASGTVVIHVDVDWAIQALQSRPVVHQLEEAIRDDRRFRDIRYCRIDCTEQDGPLWDAVEAWFSKQPGGKVALLGGNGAVVWIVDGHIVDCAPSAALAGYDDLLARTLKITEK
jgi:hypothetical protein